MTDERLIEEAAKAMANAPHACGWDAHIEAERDWYLKDAAIALAVFEKAHTVTERHSMSVTDSEAHTSTDDEREAALDSERLRQIAEWQGMDCGNEDVAHRLNRIADRIDRLAAGFRRTEPSSEVPETSAETWRKRCAEETIAWADATKRADTAEARWRAAEDECRAVQARLDALLAEPQGELSDAQDRDLTEIEARAVTTAAALAQATGMTIAEVIATVNQIGGEPSDAQVDAAADAIRWASERGGWVDMARAALRAAGEVGR